MDTDYSQYAQLASTMLGDTIVIPSSQLRKMRQVEAYILSSINGIIVKETLPTCYSRAKWKSQW